MNSQASQDESYYAVIFTSVRNSLDTEGYEISAQRMIELAKDQNGYLKVESLRDSSGFGITISYWKTLKDILNWKNNSEHLMAQQMGKSKWYKSYTTRICKVEREYSFQSET